MNIKFSLNKDKQTVVALELMPGETVDELQHVAKLHDAPLTEMKIKDILDALSNGGYTAKVTVSARRIISNPFKPEQK